jgi:hypothetical protein
VKEVVLQLCSYANARIIIAICPPSHTPLSELPVYVYAYACAAPSTVNLFFGGLSWFQTSYPVTGNTHRISDGTSRPDHESEYGDLETEEAS